MKRSEVAQYTHFCGIDVGKHMHHLAVIEAGADSAITEAEFPSGSEGLGMLDEILSGLERPFVIIDQKGGFGEGLMRGICKLGYEAGFLSPGKFAKVAGLFGEDKSDAADAEIIAQSAQMLPRLVNRCSPECEAISDMREICVMREQLVKERTASYNRLHDVLHRVSPELERLFGGATLHTEVALEVLGRYGGPLGLKKAGRGNVRRWAAGRRGFGNKAVDKAVCAYDTALLSDRRLCSQILEGEVKRLALSIMSLNEAIGKCEDMLSSLGESSSEVKLLKGLPGVGTVYSATIASEVGDIAEFPGAAHLASYAGVAPVRKTSGTSVAKTSRRKGGNRRLKNALMQSTALACLKEGSWEREKYCELRLVGKRHYQAVMVIARKRVDIIYKMLIQNTPYDPNRKKVSCACPANKYL